MMKAQKNLTNIMGPRRHLCAHLGNLKKNNKSVIDLNILLKLVEQCVTLVGQCHSRGSYFRGQGVLTPLLKDKRQVKSLLKEGAHFLEKEKKVLFLERFQKKVNETIKLKKEIKELLTEYTKSTPIKRPYYYGSRQPPSTGPPAQFIGMRTSTIQKSRVRVMRRSKKILLLERDR